MRSSEVVSPGGLLPELDLQELLSRKRVHCSRNPRLMRTLVDLGLTRDQGEGIPRMFAEMEDAFLPAPRIEPTARNVSVVLSPMVKDGLLERRFPDIPSHREQAYRTNPAPPPAVRANLKQEEAQP